MTRTAEWRMGLVLVEEDGTTKARVVLDTGTTTYTGHGVARCNPQDLDIPEIGDELAASRAMKDLASKLMREANRDLESVGAGPDTVTAPPYGWPGAAT
ncbi:dsRBD fold-containing protein [Streptomyces sp. SCSIO 30461]|uniref:dsRBD fold-containing protein n=1 Tax=Streptomyces sp. SCSIO 30461 TaxID=3118085 RepID=UPI0030CF9E08